MKPYRKSFGIWVQDRKLSENRGFIAPGVVGAVAGSRRRTGGSVATPELLWWKCDENTGTSLADSSTLGTSSGTLTGGWTTRGSGVAASFGSSTDKAASDSSLTLGTNIITVELWVNKTSAWPVFDAASYIVTMGSVYTGHGFGVWAQYGEWYIEIYPNIYTIFKYRLTSLPSTAAWHHIAFVFDGSGSRAVKCYVDGSIQTLTASTNDATGNPNYYGNFQVGANMVGSVDDVRIYSGERTSTQIAADAAL